MNRRRMLLLGSGLVAGRLGAAAAQESTPVATQDALETAVVAAFRYFRASGGGGGDAQALTAIAVLFGSPDEARVGLKPVIDEVVGGAEQADATFADVPAPALGSEAIAKAGKFENGTADGNPAVGLGAVGFRNDAAVVVVLVVGFGDALADAIATAEAIEGRRLGPVATPRGDGPRTDGVFALLPTEADVPDRLILEAEEEEVYQAEVPGTPRP